MAELRDLYQELILDHSKKPRNFHKMEGPCRIAHGYNPLCGDRVTVYLKVKEGVLQEVCFEGKGCAICTASCSLMTEALRGKTEDEAEPLFQRFHRLLTEGADGEQGDAGLGKLKVFAGVREFPLRVKCATLPWHTFHAALQQEPTPVSTE
jgi:nitrogen fixation NifU-like protein